MTIEYYAETKKGRLIRTCETSLQAQKALKESGNTDGVVRYSEEAVDLYVATRRAQGIAV